MRLFEDMPGRPATAIDTPALVVDLDAMDRNIARLAAFATAHGVAWRPHAKMHKSAALALQLVAAGACGACVQKTGEAEALADGGVRDIYISNQVVAAHKLTRVAALSARLAACGGRLAIAVDSRLGVARLADAIAAVPSARVGVFVEIDCGQGRCGVAPGGGAVVLAQAVASRPGLHFAGLQAYHGGAQHLRDAAARTAAIDGAARAVRATLEAFGAAGIAVPLVTGAGTGTLPLEAASGLWGEVQAGSFLFLDADYAVNAPLPGAPAFEHALFVAAQVVSVQGDRAVCDAGHKAHAVDSGLPTVHAPAGLAGLAGLAYANGGDEHGILRAVVPGGALPALGERVWLVPGHCDPTVNLHDALVGVRGGPERGTVERVIRVDARGALG